MSHNLNMQSFHAASLFWFKHVNTSTNWSDVQIIARDKWLKDNYGIIWMPMKCTWNIIDDEKYVMFKLEWG